MSGLRLFPTLLAGSLLLSCALVVGAFNPAPHTGGDNAGYIGLAYGLLAHGTYTDVFDPAGLPHTKYPPVFPGILAVLMALGARTWMWFKATAGVFTVAAVGLTFLWSERRLGPWGAFGVALLVAASSAVVYYSHWILSDPLFLALTMCSLWALDRSQEAREEPTDVRWLALGVLAAGLAYFTRSAGLPLVLALLAWLALRGRWRRLAVTAAVLGVPAVLWWLRGRRGGVASYAAEFWMVDPYQPALGTVGVLDLGPRALTNLSAYVLRHGPSGIVGAQGSWVAVLGVALTAAALVGWVHAVRTGRRGPAEIFFPLYAGLILLWPEVWAGDRFVLPLYPLLFLYAAWPLRHLARRTGSWSGLVVAAAMAVLLVPAARAWAGAATEASACAAVTREGGPFACYGPRVAGFAEAARWADGALPEGSAVMTRKPRHFFVLSGVPSRTFPFDDDPAVQLREADEVGARYVLLDQWDAQAGRFLAPAVTAQPGAFCHVRSFPAAQLLGVRPAAERERARPAPGAEVRLAPCPATYLRVGAGEVAYSSAISMRIPLLERLDP